MSWSRQARVRGRIVWMALVQLVVLLPAEPSPAKDPPSVPVQNSVLRVEVSRARRDWGAPWKLLAPESAGGTAFVIAGDRLLTNAHVVHDAQQITLKKSDGSAPAIATVVAVDETCDLAVLKPADKAFLSGIPDLKLGELPSAGSNVTIYGYPLGGHELSTTAGVVSRLELEVYVEGGAAHLAGQTDAAINPGNSGGPVVQGGSVIGVAFQVLRSGQNIGFFIPTPVIHHFLDDLADGTYSGFPDAPVEILPLESPALRRERGLPADRSGVVVQGIPNGSSFQGVLSPDDVLLSIDGERISDDGTFASGASRLPLAHLFDMKSIGQVVHLEVWRGGRVVAAEWRASHYAPWDRMYRSSAAPRYLVYAGLLFVPMTFDYLMSTNPSAQIRAAIGRAIHAQMWAPGQDPSREIVVLAKIFRDPVNEGVREGTPAIIERVDGQPVHDLADLARILDASQRARDVLELAEPYVNLEAIDHRRALASRPAFLAAHGMTNDRSL
jgi:S1-C subfamily serine protease